MALPGMPDLHGIPPAFLRDDELPPPPPSDPHWREWPNYDGGRPHTSWLRTYGVTLAALILLGVAVAVLTLAAHSSILR